MGTSGSTALCKRLARHLKLVAWEMSRSPIFTLQPWAANSRATSRAIVDLPTPPFCETTPITIPMRRPPPTCACGHASMLDSGHATTSCLEEVAQAAAVAVRAHSLGEHAER